MIGVLSRSRTRTRMSSASRPRPRSSSPSRSSLPVLVVVFAGLFVSLAAMAWVQDRSTERREEQAVEARRAVLAYEAAIRKPAEEAGVAIVLGIRPDITDFRAGRLSDAVFRVDMQARAVQFATSHQAFREATAPEALADAAAGFDQAFRYYRLAVLALFEAGAVAGHDREQWLELGARLGDEGDDVYDRAAAAVQRERLRVGLPRRDDLPDPRGDGR